MVKDDVEGGRGDRGSTFEDNLADYRGGGINTFLFRGEEVEIKDSRFCGNQVRGTALMSLGSLLASPTSSSPSPLLFLRKQAH